MKSILVYGDSNTHGYIPGLGTRYAFHQRWPGILQQILGVEYRVFEEGLNGRTTILDRHERPGRNGSRILPVVLETHLPLDMLLIMLGTNDIYCFQHITATDAANGVSMLVDTTRMICAKMAIDAPDILIVAPPLMVDPPSSISEYMPGDAKKSHAFAREYQSMAKRQDCAFLNAGEFVTASSIDGVHLDEQGHAALAAAIAKKLSNTF